MPLAATIEFIEVRSRDLDLILIRVQAIPQLANDVQSLGRGQLQQILIDRRSLFHLIP
jgi:hypothetical protein